MSRILFAAFDAPVPVGAVVLPDRVRMLHTDNHARIANVQRVVLANNQNHANIVEVDHG